MAYDYVKSRYGLEFSVGDRVSHTITRGTGSVARECMSSARYVMVRFDGSRVAMPCHPEELQKVV